FKVYRPSTGEQYNLQVTYNPLLNNESFEQQGISEVNSVKFSATGVTLDEVQQVKIYPNPTSGLIHIAGIDGTVTLKLLNGFGSEVFASEIALPGTIDLSSLSKGIYLMCIEQGTIKRFEKIVLK
ncbi:MAG: T9SS type A sorting domain-containing protein, partial [Bacteroidales bacterium]|nr:T9SS type A sorting domain-containing protein [Bacteroidales bacterium]